MAPGLVLTNSRDRLSSGRTASPLLVIAAIAVAALAQGGFYTRGQIATGALLLAAVIAAVPFVRVGTHGARLPLVSAVLLAGWGMVRAVPAGSAASAVKLAILLAALLAVAALCRQFERTARDAVVAGLLGVGCGVALIGWAGVAWRVTPYGLPVDGLWRAASTLTYANATAALLVPLVLVALALLAARPGSVLLVSASTVLLVGVVANASRGGFAGLAVGMVVLGALHRPPFLQALVAPLFGAAIAGLGLLPSLPAFVSPHPWLAAAAMAAGLVAAAALARVRDGRVLVLVVAIMVAAPAAAAAFTHPGHQVWDKRATLASASRSSATAEAVRLVARHPLAGVGPGRGTVAEPASGGELRLQLYVHDEYLQIALELGIIGAALLAALLVGVGRLLWKNRPGAHGRALWAATVAACTAAAVQGGLDFVWHIPAIPLLIAVLVGLAIAPASLDAPTIDERG
jgi:O-Antigen ligase